MDETTHAAKVASAVIRVFVEFASSSKERVSASTVWLKFFAPSSDLTVKDLKFLKTEADNCFKAAGITLNAADDTPTPELTEIFAKKEGAKSEEYKALTSRVRAMAKTRLETLSAALDELTKTKTALAKGIQVAATANKSAEDARTHMKQELTELKMEEPLAKNEREQLNRLIMKHLVRREHNRRLRLARDR